MERERWMGWMWEISSPAEVVAKVLRVYVMRERTLSVVAGRVPGKRWEKG